MAMMHDESQAREPTTWNRLTGVDVTTLVVILIAAGVLLRALIAGLYLPLSGFSTDVGDFTIWAHRLASTGPGRFYGEGGLTDYPPGYMYVLWGLGEIGSWLKPYTLNIDITRGLVKVPAILADGAVAWYLFAFCRRYGSRWLGGWGGERIGLAAVVLYLFNPGTIFDSAVWGQVDSVGTLALVATLFLLARGWTEAASVGAVVALLIKFQFAFLIPVVAIVGLKRHLFGRSSDPEHADHADPLRILTSLAAGLGSLVLMLLPFNMAVWSPGVPARSLVDKFLEATNTYTGLTINGFNLWRNPWSGLGDTLHRGCDAPLPPGCASPAGVALQFGATSISWQLVGTALFALAALAALWQIARRDDPEGLVVGSLTIAVAFFALPTRVHERYLFPALALAAPLVARSWRWAILYGVISLSFFANVYWVYTADWAFAAPPVINPGLNGLAMVRDPFLAAVLFNDTGVYLLSAMIVVALGWLLVQGQRMAFSAREREPSPARGQEVAGPPPRRISAGDDQQPRGAPASGRLAVLGAWLRRDPADPYLHEPPRKLDRLDAVLMIGLILFALVFRLWRLDLPRSMHFDEQYHARSATEWLADWQEGWTRDTYEWTHPPLAKYLIAAGIVLADPNRLVDSTSLSASASALAIAPQRSAFGRPASIAFTASSSQLSARDAVSWKVVATWQAPGSVASLAWDEEGDRLLVGLASSGRVAVYGTSLFLGLTGPRAPPPAVAPIETGLSSVDQILVPESQPVIAFRGANGIVVAERVTGAELARSAAVVAGMAYLPVIGGDTPQPARIVATDPARSGLVVLDGSTLLPADTLTGTDGLSQLPAPPAGPILVRGNGSDRQVWVPVGALPADKEHGPVDGGLSIFGGDVQLIDTVPLPGAPSDIGWNQVANLVYVAGIEQRNHQPVIWTVQPWGGGGVQSAGFATYDTTTLPGRPVAMAFDLSDHSEGDDHEHLLVSTLAGSSAALVAIDVGSNAFAWRIAGVVFGSVLVGIIFLLAATLFPRRRIAFLAALFMALDGMSYVMSRIAMNDIFVATFIAAAYLVYWQIWSGRWARSAWWALPLVGVLIGLAASTKWVGFYALAGLWILFMARSQFGRFLLVAAVGFLTVVAGLGAPWPFLLICLAALALAIFLVWRRPIQLVPSDIAALAPMAVLGGGIGLAFALAYPTVVGREPRSAIELVFALLARGAQAAWPAWIMLGVSALLLAARAWRSLRNPESDRRWYVPGEMGGFSWPWVAACLGVIPLLVYFLAYVPYLQLGHGIATQGLGPGYGWSLDEMQSQMFGYHFGLQAGHPAASPWWSWPLDLKPVWFYSHSYDDRLLAVIYNGGNPILFWAGIPAILFAGVQAWRRRSPALVLVVAAFAFQYLPWTRIERATFHYHYFTAVMFAMIAVAYVIDEGLRSWRQRSLAVAFLVAAVVAGVLIFPLGSALAMPDWYINAARALAPWNYAFQFPGPPQGDRGQLLSADSLKLGFGTVVSLAAASFALFGRDLLGRRERGRSGGWSADGDHEQDETGGDQAERPEPVDVEPGDVLSHQEIASQPDEDQPEEQTPGP